MKFTLDLLSLGVTKSVTLPVTDTGVKMNSVRLFAVVLAPFVLSATPNVQRFGDFNVTQDPTLRGLTKVFGAADDCMKRTWF